MSLINEALKKAQRQRLEGNAPPTPTPPVEPATGAGPRVVKRDKPTDFRSQLLLLIGGGLALIVAVAIAGFFLLRPKSPAAPAPTPAVASQPSQTPPATVATAPVTPPPEVVASPTTAPAATSPAGPTGATGPATAPLTLPPATPAVAVKPSVSPATVAPAQPAASPAPETAKPAEKAKPSSRMIALIESLKVAGIRAAGAESKVLMNDRVYRLNDVVEHQLNIRLTGVTANSLTFEDERGATYTRNF